MLTARFWSNLGNFLTRDNVSVSKAADLIVEDDLEIRGEKL